MHTLNSKAAPIPTAKRFPHLYAVGKFSKILPLIYRNHYIKLIMRLFINELELFQVEFDSIFYKTEKVNVSRSPSLFVGESLFFEEDVKPF